MLSTFSSVTNVGAFVLVLIWLLSKVLKTGRREQHLPPGPPTLPIVGNLHVLPAESPHVKFTEWARTYGDIYSLKIGPRTMVVVSSMEAAKELMDKRSANTSDRPPSHMVDRITNGMSLFMLPYADTWRVMRKAAQAILTPRAVESHLPIQKAEAIQLMYDFLKDPEGFFGHLGRYSNSIMMSVLFGNRCPRYESRHSKAFFEAQELWNLAQSTTVPPVDLLPFLDYIPNRWAWWKRLAKEVRRRQRELYFGLVNGCEARMKKGEENGSYMEEILIRQKELGLNKEMIGYLGGGLLEGGSDTAALFLKYLVMSLVAFPRVRRKAQAEIDRVIGHERTPTLADFKELPYIQALIKEVHRYRPVVPVVPHATMADEEYRGFVIPKGSILLANTYGIYHNPHYYDDPDSFYPERYLIAEHGNKQGVDASSFRNSIIFGYGRRFCPGMHLAEVSVNLNTMNLIWAFDFDAVEGAPVSLDNYEKKGILPSPLPFKCRIRPRNQNVVNIIEREFKEATETFVKFERDLDPADKQWVDELRKNLI
ncbi:cytochrome p450 [Moniliophthora roreri]|uniref:Putative cytochrome P450 n=1 Tax=Moniliophthora roreri TaxID=221103 RepID=A0A0W0FLW4_MONRR|nr:cytochrome p450 [Moniliophthora roreri]